MRPARARALLSSGCTGHVLQQSALRPEVKLDRLIIRFAAPPIEERSLHHLRTWSGKEENLNFHGIPARNQHPGAKTPAQTPEFRHAVRHNVATDGYRHKRASSFSSIIGYDITSIAQFRSSRSVKRLERGVAIVRVRTLRTARAESRTHDRVCQPTIAARSKKIASVPAGNGAFCLSQLYRRKFLQAPIGT